MPSHRMVAGGKRGMALVAVLWIVAALSILVTGMVKAQRDEIRLVASERQTVQGHALANAAIQMVLQAMAGANVPVSRLSRVEVSFAGTAIAVEIVPLNGLIDINRASAPLLTALFAVAGGLDTGRASGLAAAVVAARAPGPDTVRGPKFEAVEDLLQLPGVDFSLYARLLGLVTTDSTGSGRVNPMAAPEAVLVVLSEGDTGRATRIAAARDGGATGIDTTGLSAQYVDTAVAKRYRLVARVPLTDGRRLISTWTVETGRVAPDGVPWRIFHAEDRFEPVPATMN